MKVFWLKLMFAGCLLGLVEPVLIGEPWLGNRFAQNCAGCHAPGRKNLQAMDRRCTLSCQGCHVNPNGGGLRNFYGKWNQDHWLRSFRTELEKQTYSYLPVGEQLYGKKPYDLKFLTNNKWVLLEGYPIIKSKETSPDEKRYDRRDGLEKVVVESYPQFLYQIPKDDPYRQFDYSRVDAGGDVRWLARFVQNESNSNEQLENSAPTRQVFMMGLDAAVRVRPIHRYLNLVYEGRIMGIPNEEVPKFKVYENAGTRSLYALIDNLPYNGFIMSGMYRPLIGTPSSDHDTLAQRMLAYTYLNSNRAQNLLFNATSIGIAPNVPFANVHYIQRKKVIGGNIDGDETRGFGANIGMRFVTLGGAVNYSFLKTTDDNEVTGVKTDIQVMSLGISGQLGPVTIGIEGMSFERNQLGEDFRRAGVETLDTQTRIWRQYYFVAQAAVANTAATLLPGGTSQIKVGIRGFHLSGVETMVTYDIEDETTDGKKGEPDNTRKVSYITSQLHFFF
jgi:hypothetical protein